MRKSNRKSRARDPKRAAVVLACVTFVAVSAAAGEPASGGPPPGPPIATTTASTATPARRVDINKAGRAELKTLPGIGDAEARRIIAGRPWLTKADLVTKGVIPEGTYVALKNRIVAANPGRPAQAR